MPPVPRRNLCIVSTSNGLLPWSWHQSHLLVDTPYPSLNFRRDNQRAVAEDLVGDLDGGRLCHPVLTVFRGNARPADVLDRHHRRTLQRHRQKARRPSFNQDPARSFLL